MKYLLDTNTCIRYINGRSPEVRKRLDTVSSRDVVVCSVVKAELFYGAMRSVNQRKTLAAQEQFLSLFLSLPFDDASAMYYGQIRAQLAAQGTPIGSNNLMIAAITLAYQLTLVTHNVKEFIRVENLKIEDWESGI